MSKGLGIHLLMLHPDIKVNYASFAAANTFDKKLHHLQVGKDGNLRALVADSGNCVWAAWQSGAMERFSFNGKLLAKKVDSTVFHPLLCG